MNLTGKKITLHDMTLRDGMHPKRHLMSLDQMKSIAQGLDAAGVPLIEVTHGDGLGGSSVNYGFPAHTDEEYLGAVIPLMKQAKVSALLLPGIGTVDHLKMAHGLGVHTIRVATHCTEADVSEQHITFARKMGMDTVGFLMMAHMASPEKLVSQARLMESYGANCIYVTDSAGYLLPDGVKERLSRRARGPEARDGAGLPRPPQPGHGRGQQHRCDRVRRHPHRRCRSRPGRRCRQHADGVLVAVLDRMGARPAWTSGRSRTWPRTWCSRSWTSRSESTAMR
jgi:hypothetical protein